MRIMEEIERARRYGTGMAVIMADIDQFKRLNDEFGHVLGDEVLRQVSSLFHQQLRKIDVVCRYGGEEFGILLTQTNAQHAMTMAEKLRKMVGGWQFPGVPRTVTDQRRCGCLSRTRYHARRLVKAADTAFYAAKQAGRNQVCLAAGTAALAARVAGSSRYRDLLAYLFAKILHLHPAIFRCSSRVLLSICDRDSALNFCLAPSFLTSAGKGLGSFASELRRLLRAQQVLFAAAGWRSRPALHLVRSGFRRSVLDRQGFLQSSRRILCDRAS